MKKLYKHPTRLGPVFIAQRHDGRFCVIWEDEPLDCYHSIPAALDDIAGGYVRTSPDGTANALIGVSGELSDWTPISRSNSAM